MKTPSKKIAVMLLFLLFICAQFGSNQISLSLHNTLQIFPDEAVLYSPMNLMTQIEIQPLEKSELLVEENVLQQPTLWLGGMECKMEVFLLQVSAFLLFADIICELLRFLITYRHKQDGKKRRYQLLFAV